MFKDKLKEYVNSSGLVNMKECGPDIYVLKYKKTVFYDDLWNDFLEQCRGTIVDSDFNVVQRPFTKIYNYGVEEKAPVLADDVEVTAHRKVNGFMLAKRNLGLDQYYGLCFCNSCSICSFFTRKMDFQFDEYVCFYIYFIHLLWCEFSLGRIAFVRKW